MKQLTLLTFLILPFIALAQLTPSNLKGLSTELTERINALRASLEVAPLQNEVTLKKAADYHCDYMVENDHLSHTQRRADSANPSKRVRLMGSNNFDIVGENILFSTPQKFPLNKQEVAILANEMFQSWKNSPGHYANMIDPEYTFGDFGFKTHPIKKTVFAAHVLGKKGYRVTPQMSSNAFGLVPAPEDCSNETFNNILANMGNSIILEGNKVKFYYHNDSYLNEILENNNDGLAIDLISRNQLACGEPNQLDFSPIHDGVLLKPVYRTELFQNNEAKSDYRFITTLGEVPSHLLDQDLSASLILIKGGKKCKYLVPGKIPSKPYQLRYIDPILHNPTDEELLTIGIIGTQEINYDFNTNITTPLTLPVIQNSSYEIRSISINTYSSVEGDSTRNTGLHHARAQTIHKHIAEKTQVNDSLFHISAKENWPLMNFQLTYFEKDDWMTVSHDSIKNLIASDDKSIPWDSLLFTQRRAIATIYYQGDITQDSTVSIEELNVRTAIANSNYPLANKALYALYNDESLNPSFILENDLFNTITTQPDLVQNVSAILSKIYQQDIHKTTRFIFNWMNRYEEISDDAKYNLLHLYTLTGLHLLNEWDVAAKRLSKVIHPNKVNPLSEPITDVSLILNLHLTFIQYFGQLNDARNINKSFHHIANYFREHSLSPASDVDLALFFNSWSRYDLTINYLHSKFKNDKLNEDGVFVYLQTMAFYDDQEFQQHDDIHKKAASLNRTKWCSWVYSDFQILRNHKIKRMYCNICE